MRAVSFTTEGDTREALVWHHDGATSRSLAAGFADGAFRDGGILELSNLLTLGFTRVDVVGATGERWTFPVRQVTATMPPGDHEMLAGLTYTCAPGYVFQFKTGGRFQYRHPDGSVEHGSYGVGGVSSGIAAVLIVTTRLDGVGGLTLRFGMDPMNQTGLHMLDDNGRPNEFCPRRA